MKAGRMEYRIEALERIDVENALGERTPEWKSRGKWRAERVRLNGSRCEEAGEHFADYRAVYNIRDGHKPKEGWRIVGEDGMLYEIAAIEPNRPRGMLTLNCQRVNL